MKMNACSVCYTCIDFEPCINFQISGTNQVQKSGADVLMDLLSIGTLPSQSSLSSVDGLSSDKDNSTSIGALENLSSHTTPSVQASSVSGGFAMMDLLDALPPSEKKLGSLIITSSYIIFCSVIGY